MFELSAGAVAVTTSYPFEAHCCAAPFSKNRGNEENTLAKATLKQKRLRANAGVRAQLTTRRPSAWAAHFWWWALMVTE